MSDLNDISHTQDQVADQVQQKQQYQQFESKVYTYISLLLIINKLY